MTGPAGLSEADKDEALSTIQKAAFLEFRMVHPSSDELLQQGIIEPGYEVLRQEVKKQDGTVALRFPGLPPNATPTTIVLDRSGRLAARHSGEILYTQLRDLVDRVLAEPA